MIHDACVFEADLANNISGELRVVMEDVCLRALHEAFLFPKPPAPKEARPRKFNSEEDFGTRAWHLRNDAKFRAGMKAHRKTGAW